MGRAIKLILYYLAYQLLFIFLATGTDATIALIGGADITANFRPGQWQYPSVCYSPH
ncbi:hypothetical protein QNN11_02860 [Phocaeicola dorei]|uniref:Uncharacterized protein n=1 Tax=Phocaeicola dorei TaxID=357276 RepID=A0AA95HQZ1_9BACT|nr:hypothetical protein QNN11_02860 [Phocaeicola dorei]